MLSDLLGGEDPDLELVIGAVLLGQVGQAGELVEGLGVVALSVHHQGGLALELAQVHVLAVVRHAEVERRLGGHGGHCRGALCGHRLVSERGSHAQDLGGNEQPAHEA